MVPLIVTRLLSNVAFSGKGYEQICFKPEMFAGVISVSGEKPVDAWSRAYIGQSDGFWAKAETLSERNRIMQNSRGRRKFGVRHLCPRNSVWTADEFRGHRCLTPNFLRPRLF